MLTEWNQNVYCYVSMKKTEEKRGKRREERERKRERGRERFGMVELVELRTPFEHLIYRFLYYRARLMAQNGGSLCATSREPVCTL